MPRTSPLRRHRSPVPTAPWRRRPSAAPALPLPEFWPGADPANGPSLFLDQLGFWDSVLEAQQPTGTAGGRHFLAAGCTVRRIPPRGSAEVVGGFLARHHYTGGPGMRGLPFGLYRGESLLGVAVFSRVCRPTWAGENFALLTSDCRRPPSVRRHLTVTEAEYTSLSRLALSGEDLDGRPLGTGAATWFLCRCLAGLEARNRALWSAHQRLALGHPLTPEHLRLLREASGADRGRGRGYMKGVVTWADPYEGMLGRIYQILGFHYTGRANGGRWTREAVGQRSGRRISARTLAKARSHSQAGQVPAALRLGWEGGVVQIEVRIGGRAQVHGGGWLHTAGLDGPAGEPAISASIDAAWSAWRAVHAPAGATVSVRWKSGTGIRIERFPPKHAYFTGLGSSPWYRRQTEIRHRKLTARLLGEVRGQRRDRRRDYYPVAIPSEELRPDLRARGGGQATPSGPAAECS